MGSFAAPTSSAGTRRDAPKGPGKRRQPPYSAEAESGVLGSALQDSQSKASLHESQSKPSFHDSQSNASLHDNQSEASLHDSQSKASLHDSQSNVSCQLK